MDVYDNFHTAPLDEQDPKDDGDDRVPPRTRTYAEEPRVLMGLAPTPTLVVPFRPCKPGDQGDHVYALKRMHARYRGGGRLTRLMSKPMSVRRTWSQYTGVGSFYRDFRETRKKLGLPETPVVYDDDAWRKLAKYADSLTLKLLVQPTQTVFQRQLAWSMALYNRRMSVSYSQVRPSQLGKAEEITRGDCSGGVAGGCHWAGILPQVDWHYTNTDVQILFGVSVKNIAAAQLGDIVFYGRGSDPSHEALYLGGGRVWSFGSYPIKLLDVDYRHDRIAIRRFVP
jgi:hypothetical protein